LIDWCLTPNLAVFQLYRGMAAFEQLILFYMYNIRQQK